jgi:hypothetical protein
VGLEVDVEPLSSCCLCVLSSAPDQFGANTTVLPLAARLGIKQERVVSTVPGDVDEPDENAVAGARCHPPETVRSDLVPPARFRSPAVGIDQLDHLVVGDRVAPRVDELVAHVRQPGSRARVGPERRVKVASLSSEHETGEHVTLDGARFFLVHDLVRSPAVIDRIIGACRPGARVVAFGPKWARRWAWPLNALVRRGVNPYVTTFEGLNAPWDHLQRRLDQFSLRRLALGTLYLAEGRVPT